MMSRLKENWSKMLWYEKIIFIIGMASAGSVVILALLQLFGVWKDAAYVYMPFMAVTMLVQAFQNRKQSKSIMFLSLGVAAFITMVWVLVLFVL